MKISKQGIADEIKNVASAAALVIKEAAAEAAKILATTTANNNTITAVLANDIVTIKADVKEIKDFQKDSEKTFVKQSDFTEHLKIDADHETRIRVIEGQSDENKLVKKLVFGCVTMILVAVIGSIIYLVIRQ